MQKVPGHRGKCQGKFWPTPGATRKKRFLGPPARLWWCHSLYKNLVKNIKNELLSVNDSGAHIFCVQYRIWRRWRWAWSRRSHFFGQTSPTQPYIVISVTYIYCRPLYNTLYIYVNRTEIKPGKYPDTRIQNKAVAFGKRPRQLHGRYNLTDNFSVGPHKTIINL
jgi:hypothetical protein